MTMNAGNGQTERCLVVVEDDEIDFSFIQKFCREIDKGIELVHCPDIESASHFFESGRAAGTVTPNMALLTDIRLPDGNGLDFVEKLNSEHRLDDIMVFVWSTSDNPAERARAEELGAAAFYQKFETAADGLKLVQDLCSRLHRGA